METFSRDFRKKSAIFVAFAVLALAGWMYLSQRAAGASGNDPNTYVQMALDIARTGSPIHHFPLTDSMDLSDTEPFSYVSGFMTAGYRPSCEFCSQGKPIFPPGMATILALAYKIGGEGALFCFPPLIGLLALLLTWFLAFSLLEYRSHDGTSEDGSHCHSCSCTLTDSDFLVPRSQE